MIRLHRKEKVVVSVNRVGMACGEVFYNDLYFIFIRRFVLKQVSVLFCQVLEYRQTINSQMSH